MTGIPFHSTQFEDNLHTITSMADDRDYDESPRRKRRSYIRPRRRPSERERIQLRQRSVQESILNFLGNNTSIDTFKEGLVMSAKKHIGSSGGNRATASSKSVSTVITCQDSEADDDVFKLNDCSSNDGPKISLSNEKSDKARKNKNFGWKKKKKIASEDRKMRVQAVREKLDKSLHDEFPSYHDNHGTEITNNAEDGKATTDTFNMDICEGRASEKIISGNDNRSRTAPAACGESNGGSFPVAAAFEIADWDQLGGSNNEDLLLDPLALAKLPTLRAEQKEVRCSSSASNDKSQIHESINTNNGQKGSLGYDTLEKMDGMLVDSSPVACIGEVKEVITSSTGSSFNNHIASERRMQQQKILTSVCMNSMSLHDKRKLIRDALTAIPILGDVESVDAPVAECSSVHCNTLSSDRSSDVDDPLQKTVTIRHESSKNVRSTTDNGSLDGETIDANQVDLVKETNSLGVDSDHDDKAILLLSSGVLSSWIDDHPLTRNPEESQHRELNIGSVTSEVGVDKATKKDHEEKTLNPTPQTDFGHILSHLAVLNDFKDLVQSTTRVSEACSSHQTTQEQSRSRFHRMFQVKCGIMNSLDEGQGQAAAQIQAMKENYDLENHDLEFIFEHIRTAQEHGKSIRWDLIESLIFPDSPGMNTPEFGAKLGRVLENPASEIFSTGEINRRSWPLKQASANEATLQMADSAHVEGESSLSQRELYQEVILDLYEMEEECLEHLPKEESFARQQMLIQLLRATSDEEAHLSSLSIEDVTEIVNHIQICQEFGTAVKWPLIRQIVFPLGLMKEIWDANVTSQDDDVNWTGRSSSVKHNFHSSAREDSEKDDRHDQFEEYVELSETELDIVLRHINFCEETGEPIRWDLVAEILFPCDSARQEMLSCTVSTPVSTFKSTRAGQAKSYSTPMITKSTASTTGPIEAVAKERARAALSLSNHDLEIADARDISEDGYSSFGEDSESI